jgi:hypothetical protein
LPALARIASAPKCIDYAQQKSGTKELDLSLINPLELQVNWFGTIVRVAVVLGASVTALPTLPPMLLAEPGANDQRSTILQLERDVPELMKKSNVPGVSIALIQRGKAIWVHGFGVKEAGTSQPVTGETVFEAASLSKPVFAYGVLKLVDQGELELDVPLTTYLPKPYIPGDQRLTKITARIVLSHRTGFPNWRDGDSLPLYFTPGERFSYSGEGYIYLQRVVEQITGKPLNTFLTETVFEPLGMSRSSYVWRDNGTFKAFVMAEPRTKSGAVMFANSQNGLQMAEPLIDEAMGMKSPAFAWLK